MDLSGVGVWSSQLRYGNPDESAEAAAELEELGFTALWIPDVGGPVLDSVAHLLSSTKHTVIATGILTQDQHVASYAIEAGKGLVLVINKVDLVEGEEKTAAGWRKRVASAFKFVADPPRHWSGSIRPPHCSERRPRGWRPSSGASSRALSTCPVCRHPKSRGRARRSPS